MKSTVRDGELIEDIRNTISELYDDDHDWSVGETREECKRRLSYMRELYFLRRQLGIQCDSGDPDCAEGILKTIKWYYDKRLGG